MIMDRGHYTLAISNISMKKSIVIRNAFFMFSNDCHDKSDKLNEWMDSI